MPLNEGCPDGTLPFQGFHWRTHVQASLLCRTAGHRGGLGYNSTKREISGTVYGLKASVDATTSGLAYNFGLGFAFNKTVAMELKYMGADLPDFKYNGYTVDTSYTANAILASVSITF